MAKRVVVLSEPAYQRLDRAERRSRQLLRRQTPRQGRWQGRVATGDSSAVSCQCCTLISSGDIAHPDLPAGANITSSEWTMKSICGDHVGSDHS